MRYEYIQFGAHIVDCGDHAASLFATGGSALTPTGTIQFRVFTSRANIPIEGATVIVRKQDAPYELLGILVTDGSGQTPVLTIPAKDAALGQTPGSAVKPWIGLKVYIEHPQYEEVILDGVQLFPGVLTVQTVQLLPDQQFDLEEDDLQEYDFTPQPIWEGGSS